PESMAPALPWIPPEKALFAPLPPTAHPPAGTALPGDCPARDLPTEARHDPVKRLTKPARWMMNHYKRPVTSTLATWPKYAMSLFSPSQDRLRLAPLTRVLGAWSKNQQAYPACYTKVVELEARDRTLLAGGIVNDFAQRTLLTGVGVIHLGG